MALLALIKRLQDIMRNDAGVGGDEQRLSQIIWILFLKVFDDKEKEWEFIKEDYTPVIPDGYRWRDWATSTSVKDQMTGEELIDFINNKLFKVLSGDAIKNEKNEDVYLFTNTSRPALLVKEFMKESSNFMKNGVLLRQVINEFDEIDFNDGKDRHAFNDVYETLLKGLQKNNGEFFTPRAITTFVTDKVDPKIGEKVADFACGTGGFLIDALEHMKKQNPTVEQLDMIQKSFYGVEKKQLPYMLCATNMMLHDIEEPDILHGNSLEQDVRKYTDEPVSDEDLMEVINAGLMAPSGINLQPWYFVVVKSDEKLKELAQITGQVFGKFKPVLDNRFAKNPEAIEETKEFLNSMGGAKVCILVFLLKDNYEDFTTVVEGTSAAIQNMCLMAYDKGLATCWLTAALRVGIGEELRQKFAPDKGQYLAMLTLGHPAISPKMPPRRDGRYVII